MLALYYVILNAVKNLEVSVAVVGGTNLEILRYTQDDIESAREIATACSKPRNDGDSVILNAILCHSERSEESPRSRPATTRVDSA